MAHDVLADLADTLAVVHDRFHVHAARELGALVVREAFRQGIKFCFELFLVDMELDRHGLEA